MDVAGPLSKEAGFFRFGDDVTCYGRSAAGYRTQQSNEYLYDALPDLLPGTGIAFDPSEVIDNLRFERYVAQNGAGAWSRHERWLKDFYYFFRPLMPLQVRKLIQRARLRGWHALSFPHWPVDTTVENLCEQLLLFAMKSKGVERIPFIWFWPEGAESCVTVTHDVETEQGRDFCGELMDLDSAFGIKSSFLVVPEGRYSISEDFIRNIRNRGFEVDLQDLNHDGNLFRNFEEFRLRADKINRYAAKYQTNGFRSAVLYRNLDWYKELTCSFDMSVPNVAHLDPQRGGCCTVMPYFAGQVLEIPVTTTQDYMVFHLLNDYSLKLWKTQTDLILTKNGLVSFLVHPDYLIENKARKVYRELLAFLSELRQRQNLWFALPQEIDGWWRARHQMQIVGEEGNWRIEGAGAERARLAYAKRTGNRVRYELAQ